jgi:hypothetical protein
VPSSRIGSKATGNDDVERPAKARNGAKSVVKSFRSCPGSYEKWKRYACWLSLTVAFLIGTVTVRPSRSVTVTHRSSWSTRRDRPTSPGSRASWSRSVFASSQ